MPIIDYTPTGRRKNVPDLTKKLLDMGITDPGTINKVMEEYEATGQFRLPTEQPVGGGQPVRTNMRPAEVGNVTRPAEFVQFPTTVDKNGQRSEEPVMAPLTLSRYRDYGDIGMQTLQGPNGEPMNVITQGGKAWKLAPTKQKGTLTYYDSTTGETIKTEEWEGPSRAIPIKRDAGGEDATEKYYLDVMRQYTGALKSGKPVPADLEERAVEASNALGLPVKSVQVNPGFWGRLFGEDAQTFQTPGQDTQDAAYQADVARAEQAISAKLVTREEADRRLMRRYGKGLP